MNKELAREIILKRVAAELNAGDVVNLGIGLPTQVANYIPEEKNIVLQSENGFIGLEGDAHPGQENPDIVNAGGKFVTVAPGAAFFDSATSFAIIRGGHVDATVLGALQVDQQGSLANWMIPGKMVPGMGGAMDLVVGAKKVIIAMEHTAKGNPKILKKCTLPLTAYKVVDMIVTELCVFRVFNGNLVLAELGPESTIDDVINATEAEFRVSETLEKMNI